MKRNKDYHRKLPIEHYIPMIKATWETYKKTEKEHLLQGIFRLAFWIGYEAAKEEIARNNKIFEKEEMEEIENERRKKIHSD